MELSDEESDVIACLRAVGESAPEKIVAQDAQACLAKEVKRGIENEIRSRKPVHQDNGIFHLWIAQLVMGNADGQLDEGAARLLASELVQFPDLTAIRERHNVATETQCHRELKNSVSQCLR